MVQKYHKQFRKIPTMTSAELVERWKQIDLQQDKLDDALENGDADENDDIDAVERKVGPLLLIDVRSKEERCVSMISGGLAMDELETTRWINRHVHKIDGNNNAKRTAIPTIVFYCTIGYRSGREAQRLADYLSGTFGIEIGKTVEIKNLDGILAYSFIEDAPPLMSSNKGTQCSSDSFMTKRIHSFGKEWSEAANPSFDIVYFKSKPTMAKHLLQTGFTSAFRSVQHAISRSAAWAKETKVVSKTLPEPVAPSCTNRICATGYTTNDAVRPPPLPTD